MVAREPGRAWWVPLLAWIPLFPGLLALAVGRALWVVGRPLAGPRALGALGLVARVLLAVVFVLSAVDLGRDLAAVT